MKKLIPIVLTTIVSLSACNKKADTTQPSTSSKQERVVALSGTLSPGEVHNQIVNGYITQYGLDFDLQFSCTEYSTIVLNSSQIGINEGLLGTAITASEFASIGSEVCSELNLTTSEGQLRPYNEVVQSIINGVENPNIKQALIGINTLVINGSNNFIPQSEAILNSLTSLTADEQLMVDGFGSVLKQSYVLWDKRFTEAERKTYIAAWDAFGFLYGLEKGMREDYTNRMYQAQSTSAAFSLMAAKNSAP